MAAKYLTASSWLYCSLEFFDKDRRFIASNTCVLDEARAAKHASVDIADLRLDNYRRCDTMVGIRNQSVI